MTLGFSASYVAIWVLVLFQGLLIVALLRQLSELRRLVEMGGLRGDDRLPAGSPAPSFAGLDIRTHLRVGTHSLSGSGGVVLFLSPECSVCESLASSLRQPAVNGLPRIVALCQGGDKACTGLLKRLGSEAHLIAEDGGETAARYGVSGSPTAVVIDADQKIRGYGHPRNAEDLKELFARSVDANSTDANVDGKPHSTALSSTVSR